MRSIFGFNTRGRVTRPTVRLLFAALVLLLSLIAGWLIGLGLVGR